jgi:hypothetical protein
MRPAANMCVVCSCCAGVVHCGLPQKCVLFVFCKYDELVHC